MKENRDEVPNVLQKHSKGCYFCS